MKKILALLTVVAVMLSCTAVFAETVFEHVGDRYTVTYNGTADRMYGFVVIAPTITGEGEEKSVTYIVSNISNSNLLYIDQQTADSNGTVTFSNFMLKDGYKNTTDENGYYGKVFIGGDGDAATPTLLGYISSEEKAGVTVSGTVTDGTNPREATVSLIDSTGATVQTKTTVSGAYSFDAVAAGTYSIEFKKAASCTLTCTDIVVEADNLSLKDIDISDYAGDIDSTNQINVGDVSEVIKNYNWEPSKGVLENENIDIDKSGQVNVGDVSTAIRNYNAESKAISYSELTQ